MEPDREELRTELLAMLHAAPELPPDDRGPLADVFLDTLHAGYEVIPRVRAERMRAANPEPRPAMFAGSGGIGARIGVFLLLVSALWLTVMAAGSAHWHHPPVFLLPLLVLLVMRSRRGRSGGWYRYAAR